VRRLSRIFSQIPSSSRDAIDAELAVVGQGPLEVPQSIINFGLTETPDTGTPLADLHSFEGDVVKYIDSKVELMIPTGSNQDEQAAAYSNRIGDNVNRSRNLRLLFDRYKVDLNIMRTNCHLFAHNHKYGAKYIQKLSDDDFDRRMETLEELLMPYIMISNSGRAPTLAELNELLGSLVQKCPNLLNPLFETSLWLAVAEYLTIDIEPEPEFEIDSTNNHSLQFNPVSFGTIIRRCPHLLTRDAEQLARNFRAILFMDRRIEPCNIFLTNRQVKDMILTDPSILLEPEEKTLFRLRVFFDYLFSSEKVKRIIERNPSILTTRFNNVREKDHKMYSDFEQHLLFLLNECGFSTEQISYHPLLLTTTKNHLTERILFLRSIGRDKFRINQDVDYFPIERICQSLTNASDSLPELGCPLKDLKLFCDELNIQKKVYLDFCRTL